MKKLKKLLFTLMAAGALNAAADPFTVTINVDDASRVQCFNGSNQEVAIVTGANTFEFEAANTSYVFRPTTGNQIKNVTNESGSYVGYWSASYWYCQFTQDDVFTITTYNVEESRTASFTCNIDAPEKITLRRQDYTTVTLVEGENTVKFNPEIEQYFQIITNYGYSQPYKVTKNGQDIAYSGGYVVYPADGDVVDIITEYPDADATITFTYNTGGEGCISDVRINNVLVEDFDGYSLTAKLGSTLSFSKATNWSISSYTLNGQTNTYFSSYSGTVTGDMNFSFIASYEDPRVTVNLNIDDASHVVAKIQNTDTYFDLNDGDNEILIERYKTLAVEPVDPYGIKEIINLSTGNNESYYGGTWTKYIYPGTNNYKITTYNVEESRTATATFNVDDPTNIMLRRTKDYVEIELQPGENIVKFNPETETGFAISPKTSAPIWAVKYNGEDITASYNYYYLTLEDGCVVDITATIPDIDITAKFVINEDAKDLITDVTVDGNSVDFDGESVAMKAGQTIGLTFSSLYKIDSFKYGETTESVYSTSYSKLLMDDAVFTIEAHRLASLKFTINVDDPENIQIANGYSMYSSPSIFTLQPGANEVEIPETNTYICWQINSGAELVSVTKNEETINTQYSSYTTVAAGDVLNFTTTKIVYDKTAVCWIDNKDAAKTYFSFGGSGSSSDRSAIEVATGYTIFNFRSQMLPLALSWYDTNVTVGQVYVNNELLQPLYEGSNNYEIAAKEGDVIKIFFSEEPVECSVGFTVADGFSIDPIADRITPVDINKPLNVFAGTEISFTVEGEGDFVVMNGDDEIAANDEGTYVVTVTDNTEISVEAVLPTTIAATIVVNDAEALTVTNGETPLALVNGENTFELAVENTVITWEAAEGYEILSVEYNDEPVTETSLTLKDGDVVTFTTAEMVQDGILEIENTETLKIYDLQGRRVNKASQGFYIINGKKVLVK